MLINFRGSVRSSKFFCVKCFIRALNFRGWSQLRNYFNSEIFPIYGSLMKEYPLASPIPPPPPTLECKCCNHEGRESLVSSHVSGIKSGKEDLNSGPFPISSCSCVRNWALPEFTVFVESLRMTLNLTCSPRVDDTFSNVSPQKDCSSFSFYSEQYAKFS